MTCEHRLADPEHKGVAWKTEPCYWCWLDAGTPGAFHPEEIPPVVDSKRTRKWLAKWSPHTWRLLALVRDFPGIAKADAMRLAGVPHGHSGCDTLQSAGLIEVDRDPDGFLYLFPAGHEEGAGPGGTTTPSS